MKVIAHIETCFTSKFGIPRQAGLANTPGRIIFEPEYRVAEAVRGLEGFDYIWLIWNMDKAVRDTWSPTVRPPRLGGNRRIGVFATRSPFRPNAIGLSSVQLIGIEHTQEYGTVLHVRGADLMDGTPIYDIKPYLPYTDSHPNARSGFAPSAAEQLLEVDCNPMLLNKIPADMQQGLIDILSHDPRPQYQQDSQRIYGLDYGKHEVHFRVDESRVIVIDITD